MPINRIFYNKNVMLLLSFTDSYNLINWKNKCMKCSNYVFESGWIQVLYIANWIIIIGLDYSSVLLMYD